MALTINVEEIINPQISPGKFIERWDAVIRSVCYDAVIELLVRLRKKCPSAVILYFGMWAPLTEQSSARRLRDYLQYEFDNDFKWWINAHIYEFTNVGALIWPAMTRSQWMRGRFHYWTRRAVAEVNLDAETRGPGVLFVPSGFTNDQAVFAPAPFLHEDYIHPTTDAAQARRVQECPRADVWADLIKMWAYALSVFIRNGDAPGRDQGPHATILDRTSADTAAALAAAINGPTELKSLLAQMGCRLDAWAF